ncbi:STAS domain-containing protein [candidate division KSB1 bacterium]|nr:STAS domain-containing protein [candidate division KSB1 bacterium]
MKFVEETFGKITVFHLRGKIMGGPETDSICKRFKELLAAGMLWLVVDFRDVQWINSSGVGIIIACLTSLRNRGGDIHFANLHDMTARYFHLTKLETVVNIYESVEKAVASFPVNSALSNEQDK